MSNKNRHIPSSMKPDKDLRISGGLKTTDICLKPTPYQALVLAIVIVLLILWGGVSGSFLYLLAGVGI